jgi:hypothetical protein
MQARSARIQGMWVPHGLAPPVLPDRLGCNHRQMPCAAFSRSVHLTVRPQAHCSAISNVVSPTGNEIRTQPSVKFKDFALSAAIVTDLTRWATGPVSVRMGTASSALHLPLMMSPLVIKSMGKLHATPRPWAERRVRRSIM